jgi:hypothetical protein
MILISHSRISINDCPNFGVRISMRDAFRQLKDVGDLHHGSGTFDYGDWAVWL